MNKQNCYLLPSVWINMKHGVLFALFFLKLMRFLIFLKQIVTLVWMNPTHWDIITRTELPTAMIQSDKLCWKTGYIHYLCCPYLEIWEVRVSSAHGHALLRYEDVTQYIQTSLAVVIMDLYVLIFKIIYFSGVNYRWNYTVTLLHLRYVNKNAAPWDVNFDKRTKSV